MTDAHQDLVLEVIKSESQFAYFQLGVAASAIAFAVHQTREQALIDTPWAIGVGVGLWALSFVAGCFGIGSRQKGLYQNINLIAAARGSKDIQHLPEIVDAMKGLLKRTEDASAKPRTRYRIQQLLLFAGAVAYIAGHIQQMARIQPAGLD